ncbi:PHA/PHB synthase family protein [Nonomuraea sp. NPDC003560]|uniref:PHA/PHB synthase family protein n=1 Tax=Nonomuraea sp. NPDC003560 TaxID=3364341 RepID=UPI0036A4977A
MPTREHPDPPGAVGDGRTAYPRLGAAAGDLAGAHLRFVHDFLRATLTTVRHGPGHPAATVAPAAEDDRRFADAAWTENRYFHLWQQYHLLGHRLATESIDALPLQQGDSRLLRFLADLAAGAVAPTNFLPGNPEALREAWRTRGRSLLRGAANLVADVLGNGGLPSLADANAFVVGRDLATTPGKVVFRNDTMELIQYEPRTPAVFSVPMLMSPPWVNKYYIVDLLPELSMIRWLVDQGHTVFAISYRNADAGRRDVGFDHYLRDGLLSALEVIADVTGSPQVNITGGCLGGTLALMLAAWTSHDAHSPVHSLTVLNALADYADLANLSRAGTLGRLVGGGTPWVVDVLTRRRGYLSGRGLEAFFRVLQADDLLWQAGVNNWLTGNSPPAYLVLRWSSDTMNVPRRAQRYLMRDLCLDNALARGRCELAGRRLRLDRVWQDTFVVASRDDHMISWTSAYRTLALLPGDVRFLLASGGHVGGLLASPAYWTRERGATPDPQDWLLSADRHEGTWWEPWGRWLAERGGPLRDPPPTGSGRFPPLEDAPGLYVHG